MTAAAGGQDSAGGFAALLGVLERLAGTDVRVGGGWGVDPLAGRVTRAHHDMDLFVAVDRLGEAVGRLVGAGFEVVIDKGPCQMVLGSASDEQVDLGGIAYRSDGHGVQADATGDIEIFPAWGWTERVVAARRIVCLSAEAQRLKHRDYPPRAGDTVDLATIAHIDELAHFDSAVRPAGAGEDDLVAGIETSSDRLLEPFGAWPLPPADPAAKAAEQARTAATLVAGCPPVGFARLETVDGHAHLGQLPVLPEYGRLGVGSRRSARPVFGPATDDEIGPELKQLIADEADLERFGTRVTMGSAITDDDHSTADS